MSIETLGALCTPLAIEVTPVGSRVTCNPPPTDTDADFLVYLMPGTEREYERELFAGGFGSDGSRPDNETQMGGSFWSYSLNVDGTRVNIIATSDAAWHEKFKLASDTAKALNLLDKQDRITLFQAILYGNRHVRIEPAAAHDAAMAALFA